MKIKRHKIGRIVFLSPDFAFIEENLGLFDAEIEQCLETGEVRVVLDLNLVPYIDSAGLEKLLACADRIRRKGGSLKISNPNPLCNEILQITRMTRYFDLTFDLEDAARSFA
jgi:anti-anti-sigma factor